MVTINDLEKLKFYWRPKGSFSKLDETTINMIIQQASKLGQNSTDIVERCKDMERKITGSTTEKEQCITCRNEDLINYICPKCINKIIDVREQQIRASVLKDVEKTIDETNWYKIFASLRDKILKNNFEVLNAEDVNCIFNEMLRKELKAKMIK